MLSESTRAPGDPIGMCGPVAVDMWLAAADGDASGMALVSLLSNGFLPSFYTWGHTFAMGSGTGEYSDPSRDPRRHTISTVYIATATGTPRADDDAAAIGVFREGELPEPIVFDHRKILGDFFRWRSDPSRSAGRKE